MAMMESSSESKTYNPQEEIKKFWPSQSDSVVDEYKEISLVAMPNSPHLKVKGTAQEMVSPRN